MVTETRNRTQRTGVAETPPVRSINLTQLITSFQLSRRQLSPGTVRYYETCLKNFLWYSQKERWPQDAGLITRDLIRQFLEYVGTSSNRWGYDDPTRSSAHRASSATVNHYGRVVKRLFRWAADEEELIPDTGIWSLRLPGPHYKQVEPYTDREVLSMLDGCEAEFHTASKFLGARNKAIISMFADTGMRLSELAGIKLSDLAPSLKQLRVMGKGAKMRVLPLQGESMKTLNRYLIRFRPKGDSDFLWLNDEGGRLSGSAITTMVERLKERVGVTSSGLVHRFRHYFATRYLENGGNINALRLLLGHESLDMVLHYSRWVEANQAIAEHDRFSPLDRLTRGGSHNRVDDGWGWRGVSAPQRG